MKSKNIILQILYKTALAIIVHISFNSCTNNKSIEWKEKATYKVINSIGKKAILPDNMQIHKKSNINRINCTNLKIISVVNLNCSTCLLKFDFWKKFNEKLNPKIKENISITFYINSIKTPNIEEEINKLTDFHWIYDEEQLFNSFNEIYDERFQTLLTDKENNIILIGDPSDNKELEKLYLNTITDLLK